MKYSIVLALAVLVGACAAQSPSEDQTSLTGNSAAFIASPPSAVVAERNDSSAAQTPEHAEQSALAPDGADADASTEDDEVTQLRTLTIDEADSGRVCESRRRPGSRMEQTFCYTREERLANQAANDARSEEQIAELQREQRWRDEIVRQAEMTGRRPSGFGLGPN